MTDAELEARLRALAGGEDTALHDRMVLQGVLSRRAQGGRMPLPLASPRRHDRRWLLLVPALAAAGMVLLTRPMGRSTVPTNGADTLIGATIPAEAENSIFLPAPLLAQTTSTPAFDVPDPRGAHLRAGRWFYTDWSRREVSGPLDTLVVFEIARGSYHGEPAWEYRGGTSDRHFHPMMTDTVWLTRDSLRPLGRVSRMFNGGRLEEIYGREQIQTGVTLNGFTTWTTHGAGNLIYTGSARGLITWQEFFATTLTSPLSPDWKASITVPFTLIGVDGPSFLNLVVVGEEQLTVPAGTFDCWKVGIGTEHQDFFFWVSKEKGWIVAQGVDSDRSGAYRQLLVRGEGE